MRAVHAAILLDLRVQDVKASHINALLMEMSTARYERGGQKRRYKQESVRRFRNVLESIFQSAVADELISMNPVRCASIPQITEVKKEQQSLTKEEFVTFFTCERSRFDGRIISLRIRMLALCSWCGAGMRTSDLIALDWSMFDFDATPACFVAPRVKQGLPQRFVCPDILLEVLKARWEALGRPTTGPIFPQQQGDRAGQRMTRGRSFAAGLRTAVFRAGVYRRPPVQTVTASGRTKHTWNPIDPLFEDTALTRRLVFHGLRHSFVTALYDAEISERYAKNLAGHSSDEHEKYLMNRLRMREIPAAALPPIPTRATSTPTIAPSE